MAAKGGGVETDISYLEGGMVASRHRFGSVTTMQSSPLPSIDPALYEKHEKTQSLP